MTWNPNDELGLIITKSKKGIEPSETSLIQNLLKELARRLLLWRRDIINNNPTFEEATNLLFDVAFAITGSKLTLTAIEQMDLSHFDKLMLSSYFNWKKEEVIIKNLGYHLCNPYTPYIEIFKLGGRCIRFQYTKLEIYPFTGVIIFPKENFLIDTPFWIADEDAD